MTFTRDSEDFGTTWEKKRNWRDVLRWALLLALVLTCLVLTACGEPANQLGAYPLQPKLVHPATSQKVTLRVEWGADAVRRNCRTGQNACTKQEFTDGRIHDATMRAVEPADFNDLPRLVTLGHECWHALGAEHEPD